VPAVTDSLTTERWCRKWLQIEVSSPGPDMSVGATLGFVRNIEWRPKPERTGHGGLVLRADLLGAPERSIRRFSISSPF
jgi:hypothetical protein